MEVGLQLWRLYDVISVIPPSSGSSSYCLIKAGEGFHLQLTPVESYLLVVLQTACIECLLCSLGYMLRERLKTTPVLTAFMAWLRRQTRDLVLLRVDV